MVSASSLGFDLLPEIRTAKPRLPDDSENSPSPPSSWQLSSFPSFAPPARSVSEDFQGLIDLLVKQHAQELSAARTGTESELTEKRAASKVKPGRNSFTSLNSSKERSKIRPGRKSLASLTSAQSRRSLSKRRHQSQLGELIAERHKDMREIHADEILDVWTESLNSGMFQQEPMMAALRKSRTNLTENSEIPPEVYQRMSCFQRIQAWLESHNYEVLIAFVLCLNVLWMAFELQVYGSMSGWELGIYSEPILPPEGLLDIEHVFQIADLAFTCFFVLDVMIRIAVLQKRFFKVPMNYLDLAVSVTSLVEIAFQALTLPVNPVLFRLLRIGKLARAFRMVTMTSVLASLQLLVKCLASSSNMLFWSFCLLTFVQCVAGLIMATLCRDFFTDPFYDQSIREQVFLYYGTFSRTFLTMFEVLFANWGPACRVLTENYSEYFSVFFLFYRCVLGFAVLNVVNAVFVQQTMKTASSDEELAFKQKEKDTQMYIRKVKKLFQTIDESGDGSISLEEFAKLVQ
ncbi:Voltage-dependent T-type calcium channel subunit alpha-1I (Voltage-gated calcium channel subunit alpha Cav3.3) (Ca(v)3.3) [Durusdinium trenchii]